MVNGLERLIPMPPFHLGVLIDRHKTTLADLALLNLDAFFLAVSGLASGSVGFRDLCDVVRSPFSPDSSAYTYRHDTT